MVITILCYKNLKCKITYVFFFYKQIKKCNACNSLHINPSALDHNVLKSKKKLLINSILHRLHFLQEGLKQISFFGIFLAKKDSSEKPVHFFSGLPSIKRKKNCVLLSEDLIKKAIIHPWHSTKKNLPSPQKISIQKLFIYGFRYFND